jgi:hypothetical protein
VQVALQSLGRGQLAEQVAPFLGAEAVLHATELEFILQPQPLVAIGDMGELGANVTAIDLLQARDDVAQGARLGIQSLRLAV